MTFGTHSRWLQWTAIICAGLLAPGEIRLSAQEAPPQQPPGQAQAAAGDEVKPKTADQLNSLVAPIALYPDPLLAQIFAAATYPLEIVQCARWMKEKDVAKLKGEQLTKAAAKQPWDPSVQALVAFPDVVKLLDANITWTQDLGNAFLDQQADVMDACQRMRKKAKDNGKLESSKEQKVEVKTVEQKTVIEIQPSNPQVIYVPQYEPTVVYGAAPPVYAYPPVSYPYGAVAATAAVSFGVGVMMGAMWGGCCGGGGYGWGCSWGSANININNNFNQRYGYNKTNVGNGNSWQHNPQHRQAVPYNNRDTAKRFNGSARDASGRTQSFDNRRGDQGLGQNRGGADRGNQAAARDRGNDRGNDRGGNRAGAADRSAGGDKVGNRSIDSSRGNNSALGGGSKERSQAASNRGFSSSRQSSGGSFGGGSAKSAGGGARSSGGGARGGGRRR